MRQAIIRGSEFAKEEPIQYSLVQGDGYVRLEATVNGLEQTLLLLYPHKIRKVGWVSDGIGLPLRNGSILIEESL